MLQYCCKLLHGAFADLVVVAARPALPDALRAEDGRERTGSAFPSKYACRCQAMFRLVAASFFLLLTPSLVLACQCAPREESHSDQVRREFTESTAVFSGHVQGIHYANIHGVRTRMADIRVLQVWKGELSPDTLIRVMSDGENGPMHCGYAVGPGMSLIVYARGRNPFGLNTCSLTGALTQAEGDIPILRELSAEQAGVGR